MNPMDFTFVIVLVVTAVLFQSNCAIRAIPTVVAATLPQTLTAHTALTMGRAPSRTALHRTMLPVPTGHAQTGAVLALSMFIAARVT